MTNAPQQAHHTGFAPYDKLIDNTRDTALAQSISWLLSWDQETMMPPDGAEHRARQMGFLAGLVHERSTAPAVSGLLSEVESSSWLKSAPVFAQGNVREIRRTHDRLSRVPRALVEELARTVPISQHAWAMARKAKRFVDFQPHLEKMVKLKREEARALAKDASADLYDALLDEFEPGMKTAEVDKLLDGLAAGLVPLVKAIAAKGNAPLPWEGKRFPAEMQRVLCATVPNAPADQWTSCKQPSASSFSSRPSDAFASAFHAAGTSFTSSCPPIKRRSMRMRMMTCKLYVTSSASTRMGLGSTRLMAR